MYESLSILDGVDRQLAYLHDIRRAVSNLDDIRIAINDYDNTDSVRRLVVKSLSEFIPCIDSLNNEDFTLAVNATYESLTKSVILNTRDSARKLSADIKSFFEETQEQITANTRTIKDIDFDKVDNDAFGEVIINGAPLDLITSQVEVGGHTTNIYLMFVEMKDDRKPLTKLERRMVELVSLRKKYKDSIDRKKLKELGWTDPIQIKELYELVEHTLRKALLEDKLMLAQFAKLIDNDEADSEHVKILTRLLTYKATSVAFRINLYAKCTIQVKQLLLICKRIENKWQPNKDK